MDIHLVDWYSSTVKRINILNIFGKLFEKVLPKFLSLNFKTKKIESEFMQVAFYNLIKLLNYIFLI